MPRPHSSGDWQIADPIFRRRVGLFWELGPRVTAELLAEIGARHMCRTEIESFIARAIEDAALIRALGADQWPPLPPLREVPR